MADERTQRFSSRHGYSSRSEGQLIREDAPESLRCGILQIVQKDSAFSPEWLRDVVCGTLRVRPNPNNWSPYPNIWDEVEGLVHRCEWFRVYDIIEELHSSMNRARAEQFVERINSLFDEEGVGCQLVDGMIQVRGDDAFEAVVGGATDELEDAGLPTAQSELAEAITDLSRRPRADLSGAVHHAMAALEAVAREISGGSKQTLGDIVKGSKGLIPKPLDEATIKMWGYASQHARHGSESRQLDWAEAQLVVGVSAALCTYLVAKKP